MGRNLEHLVGGAVFLAVSLALLVSVVPAIDRLGDAAAYDPGLMPKIWLIGIAICGGLECLGAARNLIVGRRAAASEDSSVRLVVTLGLIALFAVCFIHLGYWFSVPVFIPTLSVAFGYRRWGRLALTTAIFAALIWVVFATLLSVHIPPFPWS